MNACSTCAYWTGDRDAGRMEPGRCQNPDSMYAGNVVLAYERCSDFEPAEDAEAGG